MLAPSNNICLSCLAAHDLYTCHSFSVSFVCLVASHMAAAWQFSSWLAALPCALCLLVLKPGQDSTFLAFLLPSPSAAVDCAFSQLLLL